MLSTNTALSSRIYRVNQVIPKMPPDLRAVHKREEARHCVDPSLFPKSHQDEDRGQQRNRQPGLGKKAEGGGAVAAEQSRAQIWKSIAAGPRAMLANAAVVRVKSKTNETQSHTIHMTQQPPCWKQQTAHLPVGSLSVGPHSRLSWQLCLLFSQVSEVPTSVVLTSSFILSLVPQQARGCVQVQRLEGEAIPGAHFQNLLVMSHLYYTGLHFVTQLFLEQLLSRKRDSWATESLVSKYSCL